MFRLLRAIQQRYRWWQLLRWEQRTEAQWAREAAAYRKVYGVDSAPKYARREEWQYHDGVEIEQYENGH